MYNETLARQILEVLAQSFPRKLNVDELKAAITEYQSASAQEWLAAVDALSLEDKLKGKFLRDEMSVADAAALYITPTGRQYLKQFASFQHVSKSENLLQVFICHCSSDKEAVRSLHSKLKGSGFKPWLDEEDVLPGQDWEHEIQGAVRASHVVLVCLSASSITKEGYVQKEIKLALDVAEEKPPGAIFLIPVRLHECQIPQRFRRFQWVDLFVDRGYDRLLAALSEREAQLQLPTDFSGLGKRATQIQSHGEHGLVLPSAQQSKAFASPDTELTAIVLTTSSNESCLQIRQAGGALVTLHDFSSSDGEHGYIADKAQWTANSEFFVVALRSSGGHSPGHEPLVYWSRQRSLFYELNDSTASRGFELVGPETVRLKSWPDLQNVTVNLREATV